MKFLAIFNRDHVSRDAALVAGVRALGVAAVFGLNVFLSRWLGAYEYGLYAYATTFAFLLGSLSTLGLPTALLRFIPQYMATGENQLLAGLMRRSSQLVLCSGLCTALVAAVILTSLGTERGEIYGDTLLLGFMLIPLMGMMSLLNSAYQAQQRFSVAFVPQQILQPLLVLSGALILSGVSRRLTAVSALGITAGAVLLALVFRRVVASPLPRIAQDIGRRYATSGWLRVALPLLLVDGFRLVLSNADTVMLGIFTGPQEVGLYRAASRTAGLLAFALMAVNAASAPRFSRLLTRGGTQELQRLLFPVAHMIFWPALVGAIVLTVGARPVLWLFGAEFVEAAWPLRVLVFGQLVNAAAGPVALLLSLSGHQDDNARVYGITAFINIGLNLVAIPVWGAMGAAMATAVAMTIWNVWLSIIVVRKLRVHPSIALARRRGASPDA